MSSFPADLANTHTPPPPPPKGPSTPPPSALSPSPSGKLPPPPSTPDTSGRSEDLPDDPGETWLPEVVREKGTQDLAHLVSSQDLLDALAHAPSAAHASTLSSQARLAAALDQNALLADKVSSAAALLSRQRSGTQAQLLATHALERQWRQRQSDMDLALAPFSPASLYQQLAGGAQEQELVCHAMEESFLEAGTSLGDAEERDVAEWIRRYRDARVLGYLRRERRERWDEGRVGGWR